MSHIMSLLFETNATLSHLSCRNKPTTTDEIGLNTHIIKYFQVWHDFCSIIIVQSGSEH